jgi:hypothetical protein
LGDRFRMDRLAFRMGPRRSPDFGYIRHPRKPNPVPVWA